MSTLPQVYAKFGERSAWEAARRAGMLALQAVPGFLLAFAELLGVPSGLHAAYIMALASCDLRVTPPLIGVAAALGMRLVWGLAFPLESVATLLLLLASPAVAHGCRNRGLMGWTALSLLPGVIIEGLTGTQAALLLSVGTVLIGALASPVMLRAVQAAQGTRVISGLEERVALGFAALCLVCGGGRILIVGIDLGAAAAAAVTMGMALELGVSAGVVSGMLGGLALALAGLPVEVSMCLAAGGFLAGMVQPVGRRWLVCAAFAAGSTLMLLVSGRGGAGVLGAVAASAAVLAAAPQRCLEGARGFVRRCTSARSAGGDAFAAAALGAWERSMDAMARAVPIPAGEDGPHAPEWWRTRLCAACPDYAQCQTMASPFAASRAEEAWAQRACGDEAWPAALDRLRGLGCGRLYCLRESMDRLRAEEPERRQAYRRACYQRDMLVTHLSAMAGAARSFAQISAGTTWWDELGARNIRRLLDEQALPAHLVYMRRVEGHACVAIEADSPAQLHRLESELTRLTASALSLPMMVERMEGTRMELCQRPPLDVTFGQAGQGVAGQPNGDSVWLGRLPRGRFLAAVSDGMGQGERAGRESTNTVELLRLCMEAGYDRAQTLTAVNGMILLETGGERFATVDLLCIDLWSGQASLDKLGAAGSWLARGETLVELTGDALPLGIMETVDSRTSLLRLRDGDRLLLMTDGIEDAFQDKETLRRAVEVALNLSSPQHAAQTLLESAGRACDTGRQDDMTAVVVHVTA